MFTALKKVETDMTASNGLLGSPGVTPKSQWLVTLGSERRNGKLPEVDNDAETWIELGRIQVHCS
jgi:hypothetical protein